MCTDAVPVDGADACCWWLPLFLWLAQASAREIVGSDGLGQTLQPHPQFWAAHSQGHWVCRCARLALLAYFSVLADVLRFDNTYSLMHAKRVSHTVEVLLPDKASEEKIQSLEATRQSPLQ